MPVQPVTLPITASEAIKYMAQGVWASRSFTGPVLGIWIVYHVLRRLFGGRRKSRLASSRRGAAAQAHADQLQRMVEGEAGESWRDDSASRKQRSFADSLGIYYPASISKGDLSDLIDQAIRARDK